MSVPAQHPAPQALPVLIRPVQVTDSAALWRVCWTDRSHEQVVELLRRAERLAFNRRGIGAVALHNNAPCGYGMLTLWPRAAEISDLIVADNLRDRGIGSQIIGYLTRAAAKLDVTIIEIGATYTNQRAITLYRRLGFLDSRTIHLNLGNGPEPVLYLAKSLERQSVQKQSVE